MKIIQRLSCLAVLVVGLVGLIPSNASGVTHKDLCSDLDNLDNAHLPALQKLMMKPNATPQDYLPYLGSLQTSSSVKFFSGASKSTIPTYFMDSCFSVTENSYGEDNPPSTKLLEQGCKDLYSQPVQVMVDCSKALKDGTCQDGACVVKPKIETRSPMGLKPEVASKRSFARRFKDTAVAFFNQLAQSIWSLPPPENPYGCQDSDSDFNSEWGIVKNKTSLKTPGSVTFKDPKSPLKDSCDYYSPYQIMEQTCAVYPYNQHYYFSADDKNTGSDKGKLFPQTITVNCNKVEKGWGCSEYELDKTKPGTVKEIGAHCVPGVNGFPDLDEDGVADLFDNCPYVPNPDQKDSYDHKDLSTLDKGDACSDFDEDGLVDAQDNCPSVSNPDQKNSDKNPAGDVCQDADGDGILDLKDNCPSVANPDQLDFNMNQVGDLCDEPGVLTAVEITSSPDFSADNRLSAGMNHTCSLFGKKAYCWGNSQWGQVGLDSYNGKYEPAKVVLPKPVYDTADYLGITAGKIHTCGWTDASTYSSKGKVKCWGVNKLNIPSEEEADGVLGIAPDYTGSTGAPIQISQASIGYDAETLQISANQNATCAVIQWHSNVICQNTGKYCEFRTPMCWGGPFGKTPTQYPFDSSSNPVKWVATGKNHMCGIVEQGKWGEAWCLGKSDLGQLGDGVSNSTTFDATAKKVKLPYVTGKADMASSVIKIVAGKSHSCALMQRGINMEQLKTRLYCWGDNQAGQIPVQETPKQNFYNTPQDLTKELTGETSPADKWSQVLDVASFDNATCAIVTHTGWPNLEIKCWGGSNYKGIITISTGNIDDYSLQEKILALTVGGNHACTAHASGKVYCWGKNDYGQLGDNTSDNDWTYDSMTIPKPVTLPKE